ncbi:hypothetical protein [Thiothrix winogradskyi]|uniref:Uncharacterized protein n=1 Tax=Thiothrix winogradskyi TaxID=96472 RepID=A0ABY3SX34_9GAMM|nr:hypothetical protein [Thiothrix winogradskyi]UJS24066.1 hypothetical protein L2Y54_19380 [Thiothrix winogradskyi]
MNVNVSEVLRKTLSDDIEKLMSDTQSGASAILARRRLQALADNSPLLLAWLAEPWWGQDIETTLIHCARVHLYARILDDALDENLPIHRLLLLRAQPLFWSSIGNLAIMHPQQWQQSAQLIEETIQSVERDDEQAQPILWGMKNHHLLLIPLLLSDNNESFESSRAALSDLILLMQTGDEWKQGALKTKEIQYQVLAEIERILLNGTPQMLLQGGWHSAAQRVLWECEQLLAVLSPPA